MPEEIKNKYDSATVNRMLSWFSDDKAKLIQFLSSKPEAQNALFRVINYNKDDRREEEKAIGDDEQLKRVRNAVEARVEKLKEQEILRENDEWSEWPIVHAMLEYLIKIGLSEYKLDTEHLNLLHNNMVGSQEKLNAYGPDDKSKKYVALAKKALLAMNLYNDYRSRGNDVYDIFYDGESFGLEKFEYGDKEWYICLADESEAAAKQYIQNDFDISLYNASFIQNHLDGDKVADWFEEGERSSIWDSPDSYLNDEDKSLSDDQTTEIDEKRTEINELENERDGLDTESPEDNQRWEEINDKISELESEIEDIESSPDGEWDEDKLEEKLQERLDEIRRDPYGALQELGYNEDAEKMSQFIDEDEIIDAQISEDGCGQILSSYDGEENDVEYNGETYNTYRIN